MGTGPPHIDARVASRGLAAHPVCISKAKRAQPGQSKPGQQGMKPQNQPSSPAPAPYDPNRTGDPVNKFRSQGDRTGRWGDLPPRIREAMLSGKRDLDQYPPEFREVLKEYMRKLAEEKE